MTDTPKPANPAVELECRQFLKTTAAGALGSLAFAPFQSTFSENLPNIPVHGIQVRVRVGDEEVTKVSLLPEEIPVEFNMSSEHVSFNSPKLETLMMFAIEYR